MDEPPSHGMTAQEQGDIEHYLEQLETELRAIPGMPDDPAVKTKMDAVLDRHILLIRAVSKGRPAADEYCLRRAREVGGCVGFYKGVNEFWESGKGAEGHFSRMFWRRDGRRPPYKTHVVVFTGSDATAYDIDVLNRIEGDDATPSEEFPYTTPDDLTERLYPFLGMDRTVILVGGNGPPAGRIRRALVDYHKTRSLFEMLT